MSAPPNALNPMGGSQGSRREEFTVLGVSTGQSFIFRIPAIAGLWQKLEALTFSCATMAVCPNLNPMIQIVADDPALPIDGFWSHGPTLTAVPNGTGVHVSASIGSEPNSVPALYGTLAFTSLRLPAFWSTRDLEVTCWALTDGLATAGNVYAIVQRQPSQI